MSQATSCVFCQIVSRELAAAIVFEDEHCVAFLDERPLFFGHTLVVPRAHFESLPDVPADLLTPLFGVVQLVASAIERALGADGTFVAQNNKVSQSVPHVHVHVIPRKFQDGLRGFFFPRQRYTDNAQMAATAAAISRAISLIRAL